jgi:D-Tyr-tRNAtyr deacylase
MIALIQRVHEASAAVDSELTGRIEQGFLVLLGVKITTMKMKQNILLQKRRTLGI